MATRLRRLKIEHFRDVRPGTELHFGDGWNVLVGRNGSGKTTLLNLISMVLRDDLSALQGEAFAIEYELVAEDGSTFVVCSTNTPTWRSSGGARSDLAALVRVVKLDASRAIIVDKVLVAEFRSSKVGAVDAKEVHSDNPLRRSRVDASLFGEQLDKVEGGVRMRPWGHAMACYRMDEGVGMFDVLTGTKGHARTASPPRVAMTNIHEWFRTSGGPSLQGEFVPDALVRQVNDLSPHGRASVEFDLGGDEGLDRCVGLLGRGRIIVVATSVSTEEDSGDGPSFGNFRFFSQSGVSPLVPHDHWSFGQRRLLTFFWYLACNPDVVVADELVNGLHWDWIDACVEAIGTRQVFVSAQNPLLLDHLGFESEEDVRRGFVLCRTSPVGEGRTETVWTHPDAAQSAEFFRSYQNGVMHVHDILRTQGLW